MRSPRCRFEAEGAASHECTALLLWTTGSSPAQLRADACFAMAPFTGSVIRAWARGPSAPPAELPAEVACTAAGRTDASPVSVRKLP
jgi:hypothetical protein